MNGIEHDAAEWQRLIGLQDDFVANLLTEKANWETALRTPAAPSPGASDATLVALTQVESLKVYALSLQDQLRAKDQKHAEDLDNVRHGRPVESATDLVVGKESPEEKGPPFVLVLLDGSVASFADGLIGQGKTGGLQAAQQIQWEVEKDLRAHDAGFEDDEGSSDSVEVITYSFYNKLAFVKSLIEAGVISSAATWDEFALAFNSSPLSNLVDVGNSGVDRKAAGLLHILGRLPSLKRVYLVGIHPASLIATYPALGSDRSLGKQLVSKFVSINHRESEDDAVELARSGWRIATFSRLFSATAGLPSHSFASNGVDEGYAESYSSNSDSPSKGQWKDLAKDSWKAVGSGAPTTASNGNGTTTARSRSNKELPKFNPNKAFLAQEPQICVFYYCSPTGCTQRKCERSHYYYLSPAQLVRLKQDVARSPCKEMRKNGTCQWKATHGTNCMYNHSPVGSKTTRAGKWQGE